MAAPLSRVVALIDMDCFYCACERALDPSLNIFAPVAAEQPEFKQWQEELLNMTVRVRRRASESMTLVEDLAPPLAGDVKFTHRSRTNRRCRCGR